jgi:hypothetical protein
MLRLAYTLLLASLAATPPARAQAGIKALEDLLQRNRISFPPA